MSIRVYWLDCREIDEARVRHLLSEARLCRMEALIVPEDRRRSAAAEVLLALALAKEKNCAPGIVHWRTAEGGKPYVEGGPCFSMAHSGEIAVCAVYEQDVGVDVEMPRRLHPGMRRKILCGTEWDTPEGQLLWKWVAKESYVKYTGEGLRRSMAGFSAREGEILNADGKYLACVQTVPIQPEGGIVCVCTGRTDDITVERLMWKGES